MPEPAACGIRLLAGAAINSLFRPAIRFDRGGDCAEVVTLGNEPRSDANDVLVVCWLPEVLRQPVRLSGVLFRPNG